MDGRRTDGQTERRSDSDGRGAMLNAATRKKGRIITSVRIQSFANAQCDIGHYLRDMNSAGYKSLNLCLTILAAKRHINYNQCMSDRLVRRRHNHAPTRRDEALQCVHCIGITSLIVCEEDGGSAIAIYVQYTQGCRSHF